MTRFLAVATAALVIALCPGHAGAQDDPRPWWERGVSVAPGEDGGDASDDEARGAGPVEEDGDSAVELEDADGRDGLADEESDRVGETEELEDAAGDETSRTSATPTEPQEVAAAAAEEEPGWSLTPYGFIRVGYEYVQDDARYDFVGENDGFVLGNARAGLIGNAPEWDLSFRLSAEGAADLRGVINSPEGELAVRLVDAFIQWDFAPWLGARLGQFKVPFMAGWLGRDGALPFASRAVGLSGVSVGRGFEEEGIVFDRELGLRLGVAEPLFFGDIGIAYWATVFNGNGINELLNDNARVALSARAELHYREWVRLGGGVVWNSRTEGPLPDRFDEEDLGLSADLAVELHGVEFMGHFTWVDTTFDTIASPSRTRMELHLQGGYALPFVPFPLVVNYRFAYYDPWQSGGTGGGTDLSTYELMYHTVGIRVAHPADALGLTAWLNYTFTIENAARQVDNDRLQIVAQLSF